MIQFSCHSANFKDLTVTDALGTIARMGFRYVDLATEPHLPLSEFTNRRQIVAIRDLLSIYRLSLSDLTITLPNLLDDDRAIRQHSIDTFRGILPFVKAIEADGITLLLPPSENDENPHLIDSLQKLAQQARQASVDLSISPQVDTVLDTPQQLRAVLNAVDNLALTLNWAHMVYRGVSTNEIREFLPYTRHIIIRQAKHYSLQTTYDTGTIQSDDVMQALHSAKYDGAISMHTVQFSERHHCAKVDAIRECILMRDALREVRQKSTI